jgi:hypothetical protein
MDEKQPLLKNENQVDVESAGKKKSRHSLFFLSVHLYA